MYLLTVQILLLSIVCVLRVKCLFNYTGYKVFKITPQNAEQLETVQNLEYEDMVDTWVMSHAINTSTYIMFSDKYEESLRLTMGLTKMEENKHYTVIIDDVQENLIEVFTLDSARKKFSFEDNKSANEIYEVTDEEYRKLNQDIKPKNVAFNWGEIIDSLIKATPVCNAYSDKQVKSLKDLYNTVKGKKKQYSRTFNDSNESKAKINYKANSSTVFAKFFNYQQVNQFLDTISHEYRSKSKVDTIAKTFEGREVKSVNIYSSEENFSRNPAIMIIAGMNGREWSGVVMMLYGILRLLNSADADVVLEKLSFVIVPLANPDGYEYAWNQARYWKKSRVPQADFQDCVGVYLPENFPPVDPALQKSCHSKYVGMNTEQEVKNIINLAETVDDLFAFITINGYGSKILYPKSGSENRSDHSDLMAQMASIFAENVEGFAYGQWSEMQRLRKGSAIDFFDRKAGLRLSFEIQMRIGMRDLDPIGDDLYKSIKDTWNGFENLCEAIYDVIG